MPTSLLLLAAVCGVALAASLTRGYRQRAAALAERRTERLDREVAKWAPVWARSSWSHRMRIVRQANLDREVIARLRSSP